MDKKELVIFVLAGLVLILFVVLLSRGSTEYLEPVDQTQVDIDECMLEAHQAYWEKWKSYCEVNNIPQDSEGNCSIEIFQANIFEEDLARAKELCVDRYK